MDKLRFYKYATLGLVLLNIFILVFFIVIVGPPGRGGMGRARAMDLLKMNKAQNESFEVSVVKHEERLDDFSKEQRKIVEAYFLRLINDDSKINADSLEQKLAALEVQKIQSTYQHFEEVKSSLSEEQIEHFDTFMRKVLNRGIGPAKKNRH